MTILEGGLWHLQDTLLTLEASSWLRILVATFVVKIEHSLTLRSCLNISAYVSVVMAHVNLC